MSGISPAVTIRGTWTPALTFVTPGDLSVAYSVQLGEWYLRDGLVDLYFHLVTSGFTHTTASGAFRMSGAPFTAKTLANMQWSGSLSSWTGITKASFTQIGPQIASAQSLILFLASGSGQTSAALAFGDLPTGINKTLTGRISYPVA